MLTFLRLTSVHKPWIPLRPLVSVVNSPTYAISGYVSKTLSPVVGTTDHTVQNSGEFADFIRDKTLNFGEEWVSFEVVSLFTKIPVDLAAKVAVERLRVGASLGKRTCLPVEDIVHLLSFCLKTTQFAYNLFGMLNKDFYYHYYYYTTAPTMKRSLVQLRVRPSLLLLPLWWF